MLNVILNSVAVTVGLSSIVLAATATNGVVKIPKNNGETLTLNGSENLVIYKAPIGAPGAHDKLLSDIITAPANPTLYIDSMGGSIVHGMQVIEAIQNRDDVTCVTPYAASMAFAILQSCKTRVVSGLLPGLMQHQPQIVLNGQHSLPQLQQMLESFLIPMNKTMVKLQAKRLKLTEKQFEEKIKDEWFLTGVDKIMEANAADKHVVIKCVGEANTKTRTINVTPPNMLFTTQPIVKTVRWCPVTDVEVQQAPASVSTPGPETYLPIPAPIP